MDSAGCQEGVEGAEGVDLGASSHPRIKGDAKDRCSFGPWTDCAGSIIGSKNRRGQCPPLPLSPARVQETAGVVQEEEEMVVLVRFAPLGLGICGGIGGEFGGPGGRQESRSQRVSRGRPGEGKVEG